MTLCKDVPLDNKMIVTFRGEKCNLKYAIDNCKPGEPIEGIHVNQYYNLLRIFQNERGKKFDYSVDIRYGDWRFILFDAPKVCCKKGVKYMNPKYMKNEPLSAPRTISLF